MVRFRSVALAPLLVAVASLVSAAAVSAQQAPQAASADGLFATGRFPEAERSYEARWAADSSDYRAALRLGAIALYGNRLDRAETWLLRAQALALGPLVVRHLPVRILPTRRFAAAGGGCRIDGILERTCSITSWRR